MKELENNPVLNMKLFNTISSIIMADSLNIDFYKSKGINIETVIPAFIKTADINYFTRGTGNESSDIRFFMKYSFSSPEEKKELCGILQKMIEEQTKEIGIKYFETNKNENDLPDRIKIMELFRDGKYETAYEIYYEDISRYVVEIVENIKDKCLENLNPKSKNKENVKTK